MNMDMDTGNTGTDISIDIDININIEAVLVCEVYIEIVRMHCSLQPRLGTWTAISALPHKQDLSLLFY